TTEQSDRAQTFTRRGLIQWSVPVIFAVALADTAYAQITGHVDSHSDSGHVDQHADHTDNHGDQHLDHTDTGSGGGGGSRTQRRDDPHADTHHDTGSSGGPPVHVDSHLDGPRP